MKTWRYDHLTWPEMNEVLARNPQPVVLIPFGAVEDHGPHLPLGTDVVIAEAMARAAADLLESRGRPAIVLPSLAYSPAPFAAGFAGTISLRPATLTALVLDIARSLGAHGIRALAIANAHLDPDHLDALRAAAGSGPRPVFR